MEDHEKSNVWSTNKSFVIYGERLFQTEDITFLLPNHHYTIFQTWQQVLLFLSLESKQI